MGDKPWKVNERKKCRELGGERTGPTGRDDCDCDDRVKVGLECKLYKRFVWLTADWEQAVRNAAKRGVIPVLSVKERGRNGRDLVQMLRCHYFPMGGPHCAAWEHGAFMRLPWATFVEMYHNTYSKEIQTV